MISYIVCHARMICASTVLSSTRTRKFALTRSAFCFAEYSLVNNARKGNVCFAAAIASLGRSPPALLGVGFIRRACPGKLSAFPDCRAFALSSSSLKQNFVQAQFCFILSSGTAHCLRTLYNIPLYLHNYYFTESFS